MPPHQSEYQDLNNKNNNTTINMASGNPIFKNQQQQQEEQCSCSLIGGHSSNNKSKQKNGEIDVELQLAKEMNSLSVQERERVLDDVHGVADSVEETPAFISKVIEEMDLHLSCTPKSKRKAYDRALFFKPTIQNDLKFKLMFLRTDEYDGKNAAARMLKYFQNKLELFGEDKLVKDITLDDLSSDDLEVFDNGCLLVLPYKDQVGRPIWFFNPTRYNFDKPEALLRYAWYLVMVSMQDETGQKKGISDVAYCPGNMLTNVSIPLNKVNYFFSRVGDVIVNLPMRITSYHFCYNDPRMKFVLESVRNFSGKHLRLRVRTHFGSDLEMEYSLITFGIPCKALLSNNVDIKVKLHQNFIARRKDIERQEEIDRKGKEIDSGLIYYPQPNDVLMGRGRPYQDYSGNQRWIKIIENNLDLYHNRIDRFAKTCLSMDIVKQVHEYGGRFIERTKSGGAWRVIDDVMAREKTVVAFRSRVNKVTSPTTTTATATDNNKMNGGGNNKGKLPRSSFITPNTSSSSPIITQQAKRFRFN